MDGMIDALVEWFDRQHRDLPWRGESRDPWAVLVSEVMLQQTPVARVAPVYRAWLDRWPDAPSLAADPPGEAVRMWGRLGYPRRALRLHTAAVVVANEHGGVLPDTYRDLVALPGVGDYTAAAVLAFAHRRRIPVMDTNVRRVLARAIRGQAYPPSGSPSRGERSELERLLPPEGPAAAHASEALMELGALICTARNPRCSECPLADDCMWRELGQPRNQAPPGRQPAFEGSDRQVRGIMMAVLRESDVPVAVSALEKLWPDVEQARRARRSLEADGLVMVSRGVASLPQ